METKSISQRPGGENNPSTLAYVIVQRGQGYVLFLTKVGISGQINCTKSARNGN